LVTVQIAPEHGRDPKSLVEIAKGYKDQAEKAAKREEDENLIFDHVWCVFDVNSHTKIPDAVQQAHSNGIHLAISNPCIEVWLLLHFMDYSAIQGRDQVTAQLEKFIPNYEKHLNFQKDFSDKYTKAVERANRLYDQAKELGRGVHNHVPCTSFFRLTESIKQFLSPH
jgi:mannosyltransferase OCH1-like enzyme